MGISGLLPFVKKASRPVFLKEFRGKVAAVDTYCWLHKGAFSCADKLVRGEPTDGYVQYVMKMVKLLLSYHIKPIMVFDGCNLPSKAGTEAKRREARKKNRALAKELLREGKVREARECFQRSVDITSEMARNVIKACRELQVDVIVAPYEADSQLAYLAQERFADIVLTEDSDLILFGCDKVIFKLDSSGGGMLVEKEKLHLTMSISEQKFQFEMFRNMCVLSGCDYLPSLPGIGLAKSCKFFSLTTNPDTYNVLTKLPSYLKMNSLEVPLEYRKNFVKAIQTVLHQLVFCPLERKLRPLVYPDGEYDPEDYPFAGSFLGHDTALQIALGNIDIQSREVVDNYDPSTLGTNSIWNTNYSAQDWEQKKEKVERHKAPQMFDTITNKKKRANKESVTESNKRRKTELGADNIMENLLDMYKMDKGIKVEDSKPCSPLQSSQQESDFNCTPDSTSPKLKRRLSSSRPFNPFAKVVSSMKVQSPPSASKLKNILSSVLPKKTDASNVIVKSRYFRNTTNGSESPDENVEKETKTEQSDEVQTKCEKEEEISQSYEEKESVEEKISETLTQNEESKMEEQHPSESQNEESKMEEQPFSESQKENKISEVVDIKSSDDESPFIEEEKITPKVVPRFSLSKFQATKSPYFGGTVSQTNKSECKRPGLSKTKASSRQLNLKDMFAFKR